MTNYFDELQRAEITLKEDGYSYIADMLQDVRWELMRKNRKLNELNEEYNLLLARNNVLTERERRVGNYILDFHNSEIDDVDCLCKIIDEYEIKQKLPPMAEVF